MVVGCGVFYNRLKHVDGTFDQRGPGAVVVPVGYTEPSSTTSGEKENETPMAAGYSNEHCRSSEQAKIHLQHSLSY